MTSSTADILRNLTTALAPWWNTIYIAGLFVGLVLVMIGLVRLAFAHTERRGVSGAIWAILSGVLLFNLGQFLDAMSQTVFEQSAPTDVLAYAPVGQPGTTDIMRFVIVAVRLLGLVAMIRGGILLANTHREPENFGRALTHFFGGVFAVNVTTFAQSVGATVGGNINSVITKLFGG